MRVAQRHTRPGALNFSSVQWTDETSSCKLQLVASDHPPAHSRVVSLKQSHRLIHIEMSAMRMHQSSRMSASSSSRHSNLQPCTQRTQVFGQCLQTATLSRSTSSCASPSIVCHSNGFKQCLAAAAVSLVLASGE